MPSRNARGRSQRKRACALCAAIAAGASLLANQSLLFFACFAPSREYPCTALPQSARSSSTATGPGGVAGRRRGQPRHGRRPARPGGAARRAGALSMPASGRAIRSRGQPEQVGDAVRPEVAAGRDLADLPSIPGPLEIVGQRPQLRRRVRPQARHEGVPGEEERRQRQHVREQQAPGRQATQERRQEEGAQQHRERDDHERGRAPLLGLEDRDRYVLVDRVRQDPPGAVGTEVMQRGEDRAEAGQLLRAVHRARRPDPVADASRGGRLRALEGRDVRIQVGEGRAHRLPELVRESGYQRRQRPATARAQVHQRAPAGRRHRPRQGRHRGPVRAAHVEDEMVGDEVPEQVGEPGLVLPLEQLQASHRQVPCRVPSANPRRGRVSPVPGRARRCTLIERETYGKRDTAQPRRHRGGRQKRKWMNSRPWLRASLSTRA